MRCRSQKEESPDLLEQDGASGGVDELPGRVSRYGQAKTLAVDLAEYIGGQPGGREVATQVAHCGEYLLFRHYPAADAVRLHAARFCRKHLVCPLCAIRRGAKALQLYLPRYEAVIASEALLAPFLVTLTVKNGPDLSERFRHLQRSQRELWMRKHRGRGCAVDPVRGAVWSYEVKRGSLSGLWHPHLHMFALADRAPSHAELSAEWHSITGDSFVVDVRPIVQSDPVSGFLEVFKYALKFSSMEPADTWEAFKVLRGRRLLASSGLFRGLELPESLLDEPLDGLPFVEFFFRYLSGGYSLSERL